MLQGNRSASGFLHRALTEAAWHWAEPRLSQLEVVNRPGSPRRLRRLANRIVRARCATPESTQLKIAFTGSPKSCGEQAGALRHWITRAGGAFAKTWSSLGGSWQGAVKLSPAPADVKPLA